jgi:DNA-directed RNA polymerase specialized sigma subunit
MKIIKKIDKFNPEKEHQVSVWIFTVVRNNMFDYFKKNKNVVENSEEVLGFLE